MPAKADIYSYRGAPFDETIHFVGVDLTGATFDLEIRDHPDAVAARIDLANAVAPAQGISVTTETVDNVTTSFVNIRIDEATLNAVPHTRPRGGTQDLAYDLIITTAALRKKVWLNGHWYVKPRADTCGGSGIGFEVRYVDDSPIVVEIAGAALMAPYITQVEEAVTEVEGLLAETEAVVAAFGSVEPEANLIDYATATPDTILLASGATSASPGDYTTAFIPVTGGTVVSSTDLQTLVQYDSSQAVISGSTDQLVISYLTLNASTAYIRVGIRAAKVATAIVVVGPDGQDYAPYNEVIRVSDLRLTAEQVTNAIAADDGYYDGPLVSERSVTFLERTSPNLFDKDHIISGFILGGTNGAITRNVDYFVSDFIPVTPGQDYAFSPNTGFSRYFTFYDAEYKYISAGFAGTFTAPVGAVYVRISSLLSLLETTLLAEGTVALSYTAYHQYRLVDGIITDTSLRFSGGIWNALGDSITETPGSSGVVENYMARSRARLGLDSVINYGLSGTLISTHSHPTSAMSVRYADMADNDPALVTVLGGTNDYYFGAPLGVMADRVTSTFYGACHVLFAGLADKYPTTVLAVLSPPPRGTAIPATRGDGKTLLEFVDALLEVAAYYSIPALDLLRNSQLRPYNTTNAAAYYSDPGPGLDESLHPNDAGHQLLADQIVPFIESI